jgi:hypothetical protein
MWDAALITSSCGTRRKRNRLSRHAAQSVVQRVVKMQIREFSRQTDAPIREVQSWLGSPWIRDLRDEGGGGGSIPWPSHTPDITPLSSTSGCFIKYEMYCTLHQTQENNGNG